MFGALLGRARRNNFLQAVVIKIILDVRRAGKNIIIRADFSLHDLGKKLVPFGRRGFVIIGQQIHFFVFIVFAFIEKNHLRVAVKAENNFIIADGADQTMQGGIFFDQRK